MRKKMSTSEKKLIEAIRPVKLGAKISFKNSWEKDKLDINEVLWKSGGRVDKLPLNKEDSNEFLPEVKKTLESIDNIFEKYGKKLTIPLVVYENISVSEHLTRVEEDDKLYRENATNLIKEEIFNSLNAELTWGSVKHYGIYKLSHNQTTKKGIIKFKLTIPKGTRVLFTSDGSIILPRNQSLKRSKPITRVKKQYLKVETEIISEASLEEEKKKDEVDVRKQIEQLIDLNTTTPVGRYFVNFNIDKTLGSVSLKNVPKIFKHLADTFDPVVLKKVYDFMFSDVGGFVITDSNLMFTSHLVVKGLSLGEFAKYYLCEGISFPTGYMAFFLGSTRDKDRLLNVNGAMSHEMGHMLDYTLGIPSQSQEFAELFNKENQLFTAFGQKSPLEFWAEIVAAMYSEDLSRREFVKNVVPRSYQFILNKIEELKKNETTVNLIK